MALTTKLTALTAQLASVQEENDTIRGRYLELEQAWQGMIDENKAVHEKNVELRDSLEASQAHCEQLEAEKKILQGQLTGMEGQVSSLTEQLDTASATLRDEQLNVGRTNVLADTLRRESMNLDLEGRKLRADWEGKTHNLKKAEEERDHFKAELHQLAEQYAKMVDDLSFCVMDRTVKTSSTQVVNKDGQYELLSTYLNRIYDNQETTNDKYKRIGELRRLRSPGRNEDMPYIQRSDIVGNVATLLSPNSKTRPVEDNNAANYDDAVLLELTRDKVKAAPLSPNGRLMPVSPGKPDWNRY
jgi:chromosome segregation ATPase